MKSKTLTSQKSLTHGLSSKALVKTPVLPFISDNDSVCTSCKWKSTLPKFETFPATLLGMRRRHVLLLPLHNTTERKRRHFASVFYQHFKNISHISGLETRLVICHSLNRKVNDADRGRGFLISDGFQNVTASAAGAFTNIAYVNTRIASVTFLLLFWFTSRGRLVRFSKFRVLGRSEQSQI